VTAHGNGAPEHSDHPEDPAEGSDSAVTDPLLEENAKADEEDPTLGGSSDADT
jgi:hypothetical protein